MRRREVLQWLGFAALGGCVRPESKTRAQRKNTPVRRIANTFSEKRQYAFRPWGAGSTLAPVTQVTPPERSYVHTYFDVTPFSPSQRYLAVTRLPFDNQYPVLGDQAEVCVIDLQEQNIRTVYKTRCWGLPDGSQRELGGH